MILPRLELWFASRKLAETDLPRHGVDVTFLAETRRWVCLSIAEARNNTLKPKRLASSILFYDGAVLLLGKGRLLRSIAKCSGYGGVVVYGMRVPTRGSLWRVEEP